MTAAFKRCTKCEREFPATHDFFYYNKRSRDGFYPSCRECFGKPSIPKVKPSEKACSVCNRLLSFTPEFFARAKGNKWGLATFCHECKRAYNQQYRQRPGKKDRKSELQNQPEQRSKRISYMRQYNEVNAERVRENQRISARRYAARHAATNSARRARLKGNGGVHTAEDVQAIYESQKGLCWWCGKKLKNYHVDHRIPIVRGGTDDPSNLCISCPKCNLSKGAKLSQEWNGRLL